MSRMGKMGKLSDFGQSPAVPVPVVEPQETVTIITTPTEIAVELPIAQPPGENNPREIMVNVNIKMSQPQQEWLAATAKTVRRNNSLPVAARERVYPQHLIGLAVELLQSADVDWEQVKTIDDLRERLISRGELH
jgi:hypothetical protein